MIKVFTADKDGKIRVTAEELKTLLDEAYWEGYRANKHSIVYTTPNWSPFTWTMTTTGCETITLNSADSVTANLGGSGGTVK